MIDPKLLRQSQPRLPPISPDVVSNLMPRLSGARGAPQSAAGRDRALASERNASAKSIGKAKAQGEDIEPLLAAVKDLGDKLASSETALQEVQAELDDIELGLPNLLADDVPTATTEDDNAEVRRWGEPADLGFRATRSHRHR